MGISINDLSPRYQEQALKQVMERERAKAQPPESKSKSKYHAVKTVSAGITFDSKKEAQRFEALSRLLSLGMIQDLKLQEEFVLQRAYTTPEGERIRAIKYRADFTYDELDRDGQWVHVVEDVKGKRTDVYTMKKKLMREKLGITIREV